MCIRDRLERVPGAGGGARAGAGPGEVLAVGAAAPREVVASLLLGDGHPLTRVGRRRALDARLERAGVAVARHAALGPVVVVYLAAGAPEAEPTA